MESNENKPQVFEYEKITAETIETMSLGVQEVQFNRCQIGRYFWGPIIKALSQKQQLTTLKIECINSLTQIFSSDKKSSNIFHC